MSSCHKRFNSVACRQRWVYILTAIEMTWLQQVWFRAVRLQDRAPAFGTSLAQLLNDGLGKPGGAKCLRIVDGRVGSGADTDRSHRRERGAHHERDAVAAGQGGQRTVATGSGDGRVCLAHGGW